jgi:hypothetical protein
VNTIAVCFVLVSTVALLLLPRRWAPLPLVGGACYMTLGQGIDLGPFSFSVIRMLVAVGIIRAALRREWIVGGLNALDWLIVVFSIWTVLSAFFHNDPSAALVLRLGQVYNTAGVFFLLRIFCTSVGDVARLSGSIALLLVPVAIEMSYEHFAFHNLFSILGGVPAVPHLREGRIRAFGPFAHPILAGTVGAVTLPLMIGIWRSHRRKAILGTVACLSMVVTSSSSGPVMSAMVAIGALLMWHFKAHLRLFRWVAFCSYLLLDFAMKAPAYYLIARIDVVGGSTGWHRARLIESSLEHLNEWWLAGTDYTRHWMPTGVIWSPNHTDITNYYLSLGVLGGLPLMLLFIAQIGTAFAYVGRALRPGALPSNQIVVYWGLGAALFTHVVTCVSVSYFDQSYLFLYLTLAAIGSSCAQIHTVALPVAKAPVVSKGIPREAATSGLFVGQPLGPFRRPAVSGARSSIASLRPPVRRPGVL